MTEKLAYVYIKKFDFALEIDDKYIIYKSLGS